VVWLLGTIGDTETATAAAKV